MHADGTIMRRFPDPVVPMLASARETPAQFLASDSPGANHEDCGAQRENRAHDGQREGDGHIDPAGGQHLESHKGQQRSQPVVQVAEAIEQRGQREVERAQAEYRCDVRRVDHEGIVADGQHGGNGVSGEDHVGNFNGQNHRQQRALGRLELANPLGDGGVGGAAAQQAEGRIEQEQAEDPGDPVEALEQRNARGDKERAQDDRSAPRPRAARCAGAGG